PGVPAERCRGRLRGERGSRPGDPGEDQDGRNHTEHEAAGTTGHRRHRTGGSIPTSASPGAGTVYGGVLNTPARKGMWVRIPPRALVGSRPFQVGAVSAVTLVDSSIVVTIHGFSSLPSRTAVIGGVSCLATSP